MFGSDGIRGVVDDKFIPRMVFGIGRVVAFLSHQKENGNKKILVARDTRTTGAMLENLITAGICCEGIDVHKLGVSTTPMLAKVTKIGGFDYGIMLTASHNPAEYNGIKIFDNEGKKISKNEEKRIENLFERLTILDFADAVNFGQVYNSKWLAKKYIEKVDSYLDDQKFDISICIDCSNGSSSTTAQKVFKKELFKKIKFINTSNNGRFVNKNCGATDLSCLKKYVLEGQFDFGVAYDGDADRIAIVDCHGNCYDGDKVLYILYRYFYCTDKNLLKNKVIGTIASSFSLEKALNSLGATLIRTNVGEKYINEVMEKNSYLLGGEASGHILINGVSNMGDGVLNTIYVLKALKYFDYSIDKIMEGYIDIPIKKYDLNVADTNKMETLMSMEYISTIDKYYSKVLNGRILVRPSGTEPLIRIIIESDDVDELNLIDGIKKDLKELFFKQKIRN